MSAAPCVSIVIPCFNRAIMIGDAIRSAIAQGEGCEVVVIDDGSTDDSWQVITAFEGIRAYHTENRGLSAARNLGTDKARGRFVKFLDSDDLIPPGCIDAMLEVAETLLPSEIVAGRIAIQERGGERSEYNYRQSAGRMAGKDVLVGTMNAGMALFPRELLQHVGGFDEQVSISEDYELSARILAAGHHFVLTDIVSCIIGNHDGPRLSRHYGIKGYRQQLAAFRLAAEAVGSNAVDERMSIGKTAWITGRNASRERFKTEAQSLFDLAEALGGRAVRGGSAPVRALYEILAPYRVEIYLEFVKAACRSIKKIQRPADRNI